MAKVEKGRVSLISLMRRLNGLLRFKRMLLLHEKKKDLAKT